jgi:hypothetical protein
MEICVLQHDPSESRNRAAVLVPAVFWLKLHEGQWHRFSLDAESYFLTWREEETVYESDFDDPDDYPALDLGTEHGLVGLQILQAEMKQVGTTDLQRGRLSIRFSDGRVLDHERGPTTALVSVWA